MTTRLSPFGAIESGTVSRDTILPDGTILNAVVASTPSTFNAAWAKFNERVGKMKQNVASQSVGIQMITASDGSDFTGSVSVSVTIDNGTQAAGAGTAPAHEGSGYHSYTPTQAETNGTHLAFTFTGTGAITSTVQVFTGFPQSVDNATGIADIPTVSEFNARTLVAASYFDPAVDQVIVATNNDKAGYSISGTLTTLDSLNNFDPAADAVANVTLVGTTTTNTDMRGTDGANTTLPLSAAATRTALGLASANMDVQFAASVTATGFNTVAPDNASIASILVDTSTTLDAKLNNIQGATFDAATDSLEAIRDRGDAAWLTGAGGSSPTVAQIVDGVWDEAQASHVGAGTFGENLDVAVSSVSGGGGLSAQDVRDAMKLAPTAGAPSAGSVDQALDNIEADTNELQSDDIPALIAALNNFDPAVDTVANVTLVDTTTANADLVTALENADALLNRDMAAVTVTNARSPINALRILRNKWGVIGTTLTVTEEDDTTAAWTSTVSSDPAADLVTGSDPA